MIRLIIESLKGASRMINRQNIQLSLQSCSLVAGFMVWVLISSLISLMSSDINLSAGDISLVTAIPVILGSLLRIPLGYYTNRFGARMTFMISFLLLLFPVFWISIADSVFDLAVGGFFLGIGGAVFSIGVTSLPKYYPKEKHGFINGIYGAGNIGTAITTFAAPVVAQSVGWKSTVQMYMVLLALFALLHFFLGDRNEKKVKVSVKVQIKAVYRNHLLWFLSLFYFITFGAFVAFTIYLPNFLVQHFGLSPVDAGFRTAGFIAVSTLLRPVGGFLADKVSPLRMLMYVFAGLTLSGIILSFSPSLGIYAFGALTVAVCSGIGNGTVFKLVPFYFSKQAGIANGIVSAMGGLGGFFPPLILASVFQATGQYAIGFMALSEAALASFVIVIWMYWQERMKTHTERNGHSVN
ncbi:Nitrite extrusion protein [Bacillus atrophaeus]|nr:Nitrite extrusion protein [Bacillus atrophaeus]